MKLEQPFLQVKRRYVNFIKTELELGKGRIKLPHLVVWGSPRQGWRLSPLVTSLIPKTAKFSQSYFDNKFYFHFKLRIQKICLWKHKKKKSCVSPEFYSKIVLLTFQKHSRLIKRISLIVSNKKVSKWILVKFCDLKDEILILFIFFSAKKRQFFLLIF